jgi:hypothetical protein
VFEQLNILLRHKNDQLTDGKETKRNFRKAEEE